MAGQLVDARDKNWCVFLILVRNALKVVDVR
jgi:hypothetical protein